MSVCCNKRLLVHASLVAFVVAVTYSLFDFNVADERDDVPGAHTHDERVASFMDNRKTPASMCHKLTSTSAYRTAVSRISSEGKESLLESEEKVLHATSIAELASEKNQVMDKLLNQPQMPSDYGDVMIGLYRDKSQDVLTRDFAVQHIGLYAQALARRGGYDADAAESRKLRAALFDAAGETRTIIAAAAFRALADMAAFDPRVDTNRLDSLLAACTADASSDPASRSMAVQLCGERRVKSSRPALESIRSDPTAPEILRRSANYSLALIAGTESSRRSQTRTDSW